MIPAALLGFSVGTLIAWWVVLRSLSHGERDFAPDPLDEVQPADPRVVGYSYTMNLPDQWPGDPMRPDLVHVITNGRHDASVCCDLDAARVSRPIRPALGAVQTTDPYVYSLMLDCE